MQDNLVRLWERWRNRADVLVRELIKPEQVIPWQIKALKAISEGDKVSIRSGHGVGKSAALSWIVIWFLLTRSTEGAKVLATAPTSSQLKNILWSEVAFWIRRMPAAFSSLFQITNDTIYIKGREREAFATAKTAKKDQPEALQGIHAKNTLFVLDEASGIPDIIFEYGEGSLSTEGAKVIMTGNPTRSSGYFYDSHHRDRAQWYTMKVSCMDSPMVSQKYVDSIKAKYGEESNVFRVRVLGEFPKQEDDVVIPLELVEEAALRDPPPDLGFMTPIWGLDVARFGNCKTALAKRAGQVLYEPIRTWSKRDTMEVGGLVQYEAHDAPQTLCNPIVIVDAIGVGAGVADWLKHYGERMSTIRGLNVSELPASPGFMKMRDEIWWRTREWFESREPCLPSNDEELKGQLCSLHYRVTPNGKIKVESKQDLMDQGRPSPDEADSFVLTNAPVPHKRKRRPTARKPGLTWMGV